MSYIANTKGNMMKEIYILELENEMLRKQITKLKLELNEFNKKIINNNIYNIKNF